MQPEEMKQTLLALHDELAAGADVDPELQKLLVTLDEDIHDLLDSSTPAVEPQGVVDSAEGLAARFAAEHPRAEAMIREVIAVLAKMGV